MNPNPETIQPESVGNNELVSRTADSIIFPHHCLRRQNNMKGETVEQTFYALHENGKFIAVTKRRDINSSNIVKGSINYGVLWTQDNGLNDKLLQQMVDRHEKITEEEFIEQFNSIVPDLNDFLNQVVEKPVEDFVSTDVLDEENPLVDIKNIDETAPF